LVDFRVLGPFGCPGLPRFVSRFGPLRAVERYKLGKRKKHFPRVLRRRKSAVDRGWHLLFARSRISPPFLDINLADEFNNKWGEAKIQLQQVPPPVQRSDRPPEFLLTSTTQETYACENTSPEPNKRNQISLGACQCPPTIDLSKICSRRFTNQAGMVWNGQSFHIKTLLACPLGTPHWPSST